MGLCQNVLCSFYVVFSKVLRKFISNLNISKLSDSSTSYISKITELSILLGKILYEYDWNIDEYEYVLISCGWK